MGEWDEDDRKPGHVQFSSHRGGARHRVRYVESSAPPAGECRLCVGSLAGDSATPDADNKEREQVDEELAHVTLPGKE